MTCQAFLLVTGQAGRIRATYACRGVGVHIPILSRFTDLTEVAYERHPVRTGQTAIGVTSFTAGRTIAAIFTFIGGIVFILISTADVDTDSIIIKDVVRHTYITCR